MAQGPSRRQRLLDCYRHSGPPLATVFFPARSDVEDAADRFEIRAKNGLAELAKLGAEPPLLATVEEALASFDHSDGAALALVATGTEIVLADAMFRPVDRLFVSIGATPGLLPLLAATQSDIPHAAVLLDRAGADIWYRHDLGTPVAMGEIAGDREHIHRGYPGGWSQRRFQQIAENTWENNAKLVADAVADGAAEEGIDVEMVIAGGDERAVGFFAQHLHSRFGSPFVVDGARSADQDAFLDNADVAIRSVAAERLVRDSDLLRNAIGGGRAATGREALELLGQGRIERVFVVDDTATDDRWTEAFDFGVPMLTAAGTGTSSPATDGAVALAVASGAEVTVLPQSMVDGLVAGIVRGKPASQTG